MTAEGMQSGGLICLDEIQNATNRIYQRDKLVRRTPLLKDAHRLLGIDHLTQLHLKLENLQVAGSFKIRGATHQFLCLPSDRSDVPVVTMSGGNYGKAFACVAKSFEKDATVFMPETSPRSRKDVIESYGAKVYLCAKQDLQTNVDCHVQKNGSIFFHPFEDRSLIAAHGSAGLELLNELPCEPDILLMCCGGGGLISGVSAALRLSGWTSTMIYGVETENSPIMHESLKAGRPVQCATKYTVAAGLCPPYVGEMTLRHVQEFCNGILHVKEDDLIRATRLLFKSGLVVEPSGAACVAALLAGIVPNATGKHVTAFVTGGNISAEELVKFGL